MEGRGWDQQTSSRGRGSQERRYYIPSTSTSIFDVVPRSFNSGRSGLGRPLSSSSRVRNTGRVSAFLMRGWLLAKGTMLLGVRPYVIAECFDANYTASNPSIHPDCTHAPHHHNPPQYDVAGLRVRAPRISRRESSTLSSEFHRRKQITLSLDLMGVVALSPPRACFRFFRINGTLRTRTMPAYSRSAHTQPATTSVCGCCLKFERRFGRGPSDVRAPSLPLVQRGDRDHHGCFLHGRRGETAAFDPRPARRGICASGLYNLSTRPVGNFTASFSHHRVRPEFPAYQLRRHYTPRAARYAAIFFMCPRHPRQATRVIRAGGVIREMIRF
jgi:hypothetical protein